MKKIIMSASVAALSMVALGACSSASTQTAEAACGVLAANQAAVAEEMASLAASPDTMDEMIKLFRSTGDGVENEKVKNAFNKVVSISERSVEMAKEAALIDGDEELNGESTERLNELMEEFTSLQEEADLAYGELDEVCPGIWSSSSSEDAEAVVEEGEFIIPESGGELGE